MAPSLRHRSLLAAGAVALALGAAFCVQRFSGEMRAGVAGVSSRVHDAQATAGAATPAAEPMRVPAGRSAAGRGELPLPPAETPLKDIFAELQARASAGDKAAATRLYRDLSHCSRLRNVDQDYSRMTDETLSADPETMDPELLDNYQVQLEAIENNRRVLGRMQEMCAGVSDEMYGNLVSSIRRAAELGDAEARACYLGRGPAFDLRNSIAHPETFQAYRDGAPALAEAGLAAGDWKTVDLLIGAYQPGSDTLLSGVLGSDSYRYYRYLKLRSLGTGPSAGDALGRQLASAAAALTPSQLADADAWAQETFRRDFHDAAAADAQPAGGLCDFP